MLKRSGETQSRASFSPHDRTFILLSVIVACLILTAVAGGLIWRLSRGGTRDQRLYNRGVGYLRIHRYPEAIASFREALRANPGNLAAHRALIQAEVAQKGFDAALAALADAEKAGMSKEEATLRRAGILRARARDRIASARNALTDELCSDVISSELDPATALVRGVLEQNERSADAWTLLGDLHVEKAGVHRIRIRRAEDEWKKARKLRQKENLEATRVRVLDLLAELRRENLLASRAYERAIENDPEGVPPRLALAEQYLVMAVPDASRAKKVLEPVLQADPQNSRAIVLLAQAERLLGDTRRAVELLQRVPAGATQKMEATILEADAHIELGNWDAADRLTRDLAETNPSHPWVAYLRARVLLHAGDSDRAIALLQNIFASESVRWPQARFELATALMASGKREQALQAYRDVVTDADIALAGATIKREELLRMKHDACTLLASELRLTSSREAVTYALAAFDLDPGSSADYRLARDILLAAQERTGLNRLFLAHVRALLAAGRWDDALSVCRSDRLIPENPTDADRLSAAALVGKGQFSDAIAIYERLLETRSPDRQQFQLEMADLYLQLERPADAERIYREILSETPGDARAVRGLAALLVATNRLDEANDLLLSSRASDERVNELGLPLLYVYLRGKRLDAAMELVETQLRQHPDNATLLLLAANLVWEKGDRASARSYFDKALALEKPPPWAFTRALLDLAEEKYADAENLANEGLRRYPQAPTLNVILAVALQGQGKTATAEEALGRALEDVRLPPDMRQTAALILEVLQAGEGVVPAAGGPPSNEPAGPAPEGMSIGDRAPSRSNEEILRFLDAIRNLPDADRQRASLAFNAMILMMNTGILNEARVQVGTVEGLIPGSPLPGLEKARILDRLGLHEDAVVELESVIQRHPDSVFARQQKAQSHIAAGEREAAVGELEALLRMGLTDAERASVHWSLGVQCEALGRYDEAIAHYTAATKSPATAPWAYNNLAWILATEKGDLDGALPYARKAHEAEPDAPPVLDTLGWILFLRGDHEEALPLLERAARSMPAEPGLRYRLARAYHQVGKDAEALAELEQVLALGRPFREAAQARELAEALDRRTPPARENGLTETNTESGRTEHEPER